MGLGELFNKCGRIDYGRSLNKIFLIAQLSAKTLFGFLDKEDKFAILLLRPKQFVPCFFGPGVHIAH